MSALATSRRRTLAAIIVGALVTALAVVAVPGILPASADRTSLTFGYSDAVQTLTVPDGITQLTVSMLGGEGGIGGWDSVGPLPGGYRGAVTGALAVTPGEVITIGVGHGGYDGQNTEPNAYGGTGGSNPIDGYSGGTGGIAGPEGDSGGGAGGGAATVLRIGDQTIVAGGGGGGGGSGQFEPTQGRPGASTFTAADDPTTGVGQDGINTVSVCVDGIRCDGGASGAGGGGAIGGGPGQVAYGADYSTEYFGYGGSPGANDATGLTAGSSVYQWYDGNDADGSVTITYDTSAPGVPTGVSGTAADGSASVTWLDPLNTGGSVITDYAIQYAVAGDSPDWQDFADATSGSTSAIVTDLVDDTDYVFRVAAINAFGTSDWSDASSIVTPSTVPSAPTLSSVTSSDGALVATFTTVTATSPVTGYQYQLDGGTWVAAGASSPATISALTNGTSYSVAIRAVNAIGQGDASNALSGTPLAIPGAPTITGVTPAIASATVSFSAGNAGGSPVTGYDYRLDGGSWVSTGSTSSPFTISGLANATSFILDLRAKSIAGDGDASAPATFATPSTPGAPTIGVISVGDGTLSVNFAAGSNGGLGISGYDYQLSTNGAWTAAINTSSPLSLAGLTNGTSYQVSLRARNALGSGTPADAVTATPVTTPGAPTLLAGSVVGSNQELDATFTAPTSDGGTAITGYEYSTDGGITWRTRATGTTGSPLVITTLSTDGTTALVNGTTYPVEVRAVNAVGSGTSSGVAIGIARTIPAAPTLISVTSLPNALQAHFAAASNGGSPITSYQYRLGTGGWNDTGTLGQTFAISGLINGITYGVQVRAVNGVGVGASSANINGVPASQPGQPTITGITSGNASLVVSASAGSTGGAPITGWQYSTDGGTTWATTSRVTGPYTISLQSGTSTPLVNGVSYSIALRAVNSAGAGTASSTQHGIPMTTPSAPTIAVTPQDSGLSVSYTAGNSGGSSVTGVQYSVGGGWVSVGSLQTTFSIGSLINGASYPVQVRLVNAVGAGTASAITPASPRSVPTAPLAVTAVPDGGQATIGWLVPASDGGSPVTGYTATAWSSSSNGSAIGSCTTTDLSCVITGLTNGIAYFVSVTATNIAGDGAPSAPRAAVVPLAKPDAPTIDGIAAANTYLTVYFSAGDPGSTPITGFEYSFNGIDWLPTASTDSPLIISGLSNGTTYSVQLRADNASGAGASSDPTDGTPYGVPDVPDASQVTATVGNYWADVNWVAPNDNGSEIYNYTVTAWSSPVQGSQWGSCSTSGETSCTLYLWEGNSFYITVEATNAAGTTARSAPRLEVTPGAPGQVSELTGVASNHKVDLSWTPGEDGDGPTNGYTVWYAPVGQSDFTQFGDVWSGNDAMVTGLTNGTSYVFKVYAENWVGLGQPATSIPYTPVAIGEVPTFGSPTPTADGFTATILRYDPSTLYSVTSDHGSAALSGDSITVAGLDAGQQATVTVTAQADGVPDEQGTVTGSALLAGTVPEFGTPVRTADGYTVELLNSASGVLYSPTATDGEVTLSGTTLTVVDLAPGDSSTITLSATQDGHTDSSADVTGSALETGVAAALGTPVRTADGYFVPLLNLRDLSGFEYSLTAGTASFSFAGFTISGLTPGQSSTFTVRAFRRGSTDATSSAEGAALDAGADLRTGAMYQFADGFSFPLLGYDPSFSYSISFTAGTMTFVDGTVTISGLAIGEESDVWIYATKSGHSDSQVGIGGNPMPLPGTAPVLTTPVSTATGFTTTISNYSADSAYTVTADAGQVSLLGTLVTVTGLAAGQSATVTVSADQLGYSTASSTVLGTAIAAVAPVITPAVSVTSDVSSASDNVAPDPQLFSSDSPPSVTSVVKPHAKATLVAHDSVWVSFTIGALVMLIAIALLIAWLRRRKRPVAD